MAKAVPGQVSPRTMINNKGLEGKDKKPGSWNLQRLWAFCVGPVLCLALFLGHIHLARRESSKETSEPATSPVQVLTAASFKDLIRANPSGVLVDFYSQGCAHCLTLAPEFDLAARQLSGSTAFATVDAEAEAALAKKFGIHRYPTVLWLVKGESVQELPPRSRTADKIKEFVDWVKQPALIEFETRADLEEAVPTLRETMKNSLPPVVAGFAGTKGLREAFERAAQHFRGKTVFLFITEAKEEGPLLRSISQLPEDDKTFDGPVSKEAVYEWVKELVSKKEKELEGQKDEQVETEEASVQDN